MAYVADAGGLVSRAVAPTHSHVIQAGMCLIQAGQTVSSLIAGDPLRTALVAAEAALGMEVAPWQPTCRNQPGTS
ncbi:hypothetical protein Cci01nite_71970 [Catellatospora citrea]|uniref:Uncharacterized protein n=2 Tax=Catellatospora citrea TaxID=53366 RepID=A0A8J3P382_9ACTN|nr:hypothetical protein Cci01nite_71970 [Catellatospora citrea]